MSIPYAGCVVRFPGLRKRTGAWAICHGILWPVLLVDTQCPTSTGHNSLIGHEAYHAKKRHKLKEIFLWILWPTVLGFFAWALFRRRIERTADEEALRIFGDEDFRAFLAMHKPPSSWWGRFKYGATIEARYKRATRREWSDVG